MEKQRVELKLTLDINSDKSIVYQKLTSIDGLADWWTMHTEGDAGKNGIIHFNFANNARISVRVKDLENNTSVVWDYVGSDPEWMGSIIRFDLRNDGDHCTLSFHQWNIPAYTEFIARCNYSWAGYLRSLKMLCETGKGAPYGSEAYATGS